jgi:hypothetical protein
LLQALSIPGNPSIHPPEYIKLHFCKRYLGFKVASYMLNIHVEIGSKAEFVG